MSSCVYISVRTCPRLSFFLSRSKPPFGLLQRREPSSCRTRYACVFFFISLSVLHNRAPRIDEPRAIVRRRFRRKSPFWRSDFIRFFFYLFRCHSTTWPVRKLDFFSAEIGHVHGTFVVRCKGNAPLFYLFRQWNYLHRSFHSEVSSSYAVVITKPYSFLWMFRAINRRSLNLKFLLGELSHETDRHLPSRTFLDEIQWWTTFIWMFWYFNHSLPANLAALI